MIELTLPRFYKLVTKTRDNILVSESIQYCSLSLSGSAWTCNKSSQYMHHSPGQLSRLNPQPALRQENQVNYCPVAWVQHHKLLFSPPCCKLFPFTAPPGGVLSNHTEITETGRREDSIPGLALYVWRGDLPRNISEFRQCPKSSSWSVS